MRAIAVRRGESTATVVDVPRPEPGPGEALVRTLRVGIDGTDREVLAGDHGGFPEDEAFMILGHEAVGVVDDPGDTDLERGDVVAPTVRRPPETGTNDYFRRGEADMAPPGATVERGIDGAHGFMAEFFTSPAEFLVELPPYLAEWGFLVEPISITEKALEHARASRSAFEWDPESALVLGNGSLGLLTLAMLDDYDRTYCLGRRERPDPTIDVIERLGGTYVNSTETPVPEIPETHESMDLVYEATGYAKHAFEAIEALAPGGVAALLGVPTDWRFEVDGGRLHREIVMENKAVVGCVNSSPDHFRAAADRLAGLPDWLPEAIVGEVAPPEELDRAFDDGPIKTAIEFDTR